MNICNFYFKNQVVNRQVRQGKCKKRLIMLTDNEKEGECGMFSSEDLHLKSMLSRKENEMLFEGMQESDSAIEFLHNFITQRYKSQRGA